MVLLMRGVGNTKFPIAHRLGFLDDPPCKWFEQVAMCCTLQHDILTLFLLMRCSCLLGTNIFRVASVGSGT